MEQDKRINRGVVVVPDLAIELVMPYIDDPRDRHAISLVCKGWWKIDSSTRKDITVSFCYSTTPELLMRRFPLLESLKLKGQPRAAKYKYISENWGGYAGPWIRASVNGFPCLKSLHFRRMIVTDEDLEVLANSPRGHMLDTLKLDNCSGFSTTGLLHVARSCRCLKTLFLEESSIQSHDGEWLHELALNNTTLETLNFYLTNLSNINVRDLELIATKCRSLVSVKIGESEIVELINFFQAATVLEEFCGGYFEYLEDKPDYRYALVAFPPKLCSLGLTYLGKHEMPMVLPFANSLKKLDLLSAALTTKEHCQLVQLCPNLEVIRATSRIGNIGLEVLAQHCKKLRRVRIERVDEDIEDEDEDEDIEDEDEVVSHRGLSALAQGCVDLEYIGVHVTDINNACLETIGTFCKNLRDFRLVLLDREENITELPLDNGVRELLRGCQNIKRFALYLRQGGLTDVGLRYVGEYGINVKCLLLGNVGESDTGLMNLSRGCPNLQKLELKACRFSLHALSLSVMQLASLRYLYVLEYVKSESDFLDMTRPCWIIESIPPTRVKDQDGTIHHNPHQLLAYYSLAPPRTDHPSDHQVQ